MTTPPTDQQLDEIAKAVADYRQHPDIGFACCTAHPVADAGAALVAEVRRQRTELAAEQRRHGDTIDDRDRAQDAADKLAYAVAPENVIGEHTADNSPWENALDLLTPMAEVDRLRTELAAVHAFLDEQDRAARAFELPTPEWVEAVRAASVPPAAPLRPVQPSGVPSSTQSPTGAPEGALGASGAEQRDRRERYARAIHDAMEPDLSLVDQEPACQALFARAAEAAVALASADNPTHLRWGLNDVLWSDDDSVIVLLSGPDREAYWLELDPERAAVLREDLAGPAEDPAPAEDFTGTQPCGHDDYHDPHPWADRPDLWCPGIGYDDAAEAQPTVEACGKCKQQLDPAGPRTRRAHQPETAYCRRCVDRCHDSEIADHRCVICA